MAQRPVALEVIPIEDVPRRHRWLELKFFAWYFLGYSAIVFWAEFSVFFYWTSFLNTFRASIVRFIAVWCIGLNLILAFWLTVVGLEDHRLARVKRLRQLALRFHPLCAPVWWPVHAIRCLVRLARSRRTVSAVPFSRDWVLNESEDDEDDDVPAA
jgi:hypothetical protein